jgi:hypothetical protein
MRLGLGLLFACALALPARAQSTGNELLSKCEVFLDNYKAIGPETFQTSLEPEGWQCFGYMSAVSQFAYLIFRSNSGDDKKVFDLVCLPPDAQVSRLIRVFVAYGRQHPERLNQSPESLVLTSLWQAFPCK